MQPIVYGPLKISQSNGEASIEISDSVSIGGGSMAGVVSASGSASIVIKEMILIDAGLKLLAASVPSMTAAIAMIQPFVDAELAKI